MNRKNKRGDFNFVWLFAVIAGTAILILAITGAIRYGKTISITQDTEMAKALSVVTDSMQAGFAAGRKSTINFKKETIIDNQCFDGSFGRNDISILTMERANKDFEIGGVPIRVLNKYLFVSDVPAKYFYVFSVPISFAFKIADAIIIDSQEYCFIGLEEGEVYRTLEVIGEKAKFGLLNCTEDSVKVCFGYGRCNLQEGDINVISDCSGSICEYDFEIGRVERKGESVNYVGNLLYPAIFSSRENYLCNVKRLLYRQYVLSGMYIEKTELMNYRGCNNVLGEDLETLRNFSFDLSQNLPMTDLTEMYIQAKSIERGEEVGQCKLWS